jgi:AcrR family transcriptional regulator
MGRPREHDERTAAALLAAAEALVQDGGPDAVSIRTVASKVGTTTRAVYSLYGSKQGLMDALAVHAFHLLHDGVGQLPTTQASVEDVVEAGLVFRRFAVEHPSLFRIAFGSTREGPIRARPLVRHAAIVALDVLKTRIARLADAGLIDGDRVDEVTLYFDALCEGLAAVELRGTFPPEAAERIWTDGLTAIVRGLASREIPRPAHAGPAFAWTNATRAPDQQQPA